MSSACLAGQCRHDIERANRAMLALVSLSAAVVLSCSEAAAGHYACMHACSSGETPWPLQAAAGLQPIDAALDSLYCCTLPILATLCTLSPRWPFAARLHGCAIVAMCCGISHVAHARILALHHSARLCALALRAACERAGAV